MTQAAGTAEREAALTIPAALTARGGAMWPWLCAAFLGEGESAAAGERRAVRDR